MKDVYLYQDGKTTGPFTKDQLTTMWRSGQINKATQFAFEDGDWQPLDNICHKFKPMGLFRIVLNVVLILIFLSIAGAFIVSFLAVALSGPDAIYK